MALQMCRVWPGAMSSGSVRSSHGARSNTEAQSYEADQGNVYRFVLLLRGTLSAERHVYVLVSLKLYGPPGSLQMFVAVEHPAGGVGCTRDGPGRWEGKCRPGTDAKASSEAQSEEGKHRFLCKVRRCVVAVCIRFPKFDAPGTWHRVFCVELYARLSEAHVEVQV